MEFGRLLGWLILNVAVPLLAPIALLPLVGARRRYAGQVKAILRSSLGDGQLLWTVIAMCAAAWYEAAVHMGELQGTAEQVSKDRFIAWAAIGWHTGVIVFSSVLVLLGTMDEAEEPLESLATTTSPPRQPRKIMLISICMSVFTAVTVTVTHVWAS